MLHCLDLTQILISSPSLSPELQTPWGIESVCHQMLPSPLRSSIVFSNDTSKRKPQISILTLVPPVISFISVNVYCHFKCSKNKTLYSWLLNLFLFAVQSITKSCCIYVLSIPIPLSTSIVIILVQVTSSFSWTIAVFSQLIFLLLSLSSIVYS